MVVRPIPIVAVTIVKRRDAKIKAAEPEAFAITASDAPHVSAAKAAFETAMLPRMLQVKAGIVAALIVANPLAVGMDVRRLGVALFIGILRMIIAALVITMLVVAVLRLRGMRSGLDGRGPVTRYVTATYVVSWPPTAAVLILRESGNGAEQAKCKNSQK